MLAEWELVQVGKAREQLDKLHKLWIRMQFRYYHLDGEACAMSLAGEKCEEGWEAVSRCWHCAGGRYSSLNLGACMRRAEETARCGSARVRVRAIRE